MWNVSYLHIKSFFLQGFGYFLVGVIAFYCCISIYLYGDLAIYAAAVPKSLMNVVWSVEILLLKVKDTSHVTVPITLLACCSTFPGERNVSVNETHSAAGCNPNLKLTDLCWSKHELTRGAVYRIFVVTYKFLQLLQWKKYWCN